MEWKQNSTAASEVAGSSASSLTRGSWPVRTSDHQKLVPTFRWIDNCLAVTKRDFLKNGSVITIKREIPKWKCRIRMAGCLPYAVGKQPSMPVINRGRERTLRDDDPRLICRGFETRNLFPVLCACKHEVRY